MMQANSKAMTADRIKRLDDIGFNWVASRRFVVIQPNMSLGLIVTNRYVVQRRQLVVEKVNDNSILKGKVFPADRHIEVQFDNEATDVIFWEFDRFQTFLARKRGQEKKIVFCPPEARGCYNLIPILCNEAKTDKNL
jgi:hypothetical protein